MPRYHKPVDPRHIIKIEVLELPTVYEAGQGQYDLRKADTPDNYELHDLFSLERELKRVMPKRVDDILCRLQNFRVAYLNTESGEITS